MDLFVIKKSFYKPLIRHFYWVKNMKCFLPKKIIKKVHFVVEKLKI